MSIAVTVSLFAWETGCVWRESLSGNINNHCTLVRSAFSNWNTIWTSFSFLARRIHRRKSMRVVTNSSSALINRWSDQERLAYHWSHCKQTGRNQFTSTSDISSSLSLFSQYYDCVSSQLPSDLTTSFCWHLICAGAACGKCLESHPRPRRCP
jgi:hypothetical protein